MKTKLIQINSNENNDQIKEIARAIKLGKLVIFPTETVYGIGTNALDKEAVNKIFEAKGRKNDNPLIVHICDETMLIGLVNKMSNIEKRLTEAFWPGPFTIILEKTFKIPMNVTSGLNTVGIRMPSNEIAIQLIKEAGVPIAAPSANISGRPSGTKIEDIKEEFEGKVEYIIDGGMSEIGIESTVVKVSKDGVVNILRPGKITMEDIQELGIKVMLDKNTLNKIKKEKTDINTTHGINDYNILKEVPVESPGMKYRHYAPKTKCVLVISNEEKNISKKINTIILGSKSYIKKKQTKIKSEHQRTRVLVVSKTNNAKKYNKNADFVVPMGDTLEEISKNIFSILRQVDRYNVDIVFIEGVKKEGLGLAIMNRLIRACEYNIVEV